MPREVRLTEPEPHPVQIVVDADPGTKLRASASVDIGRAEVTVFFAAEVDHGPVDSGGLWLQATGKGIVILVKAPIGSTVRTSLPLESVDVRGDLSMLVVDRS